MAIKKQPTKTKETKVSPGAKELINTITKPTKELSEQPQTVSKSITTINHKSKEAEEVRQNKCKAIIQLIETKGESLNKAAKQIGIDTRTFHDMIQKDTSLLHHYARAMELRADLIAERMVRNSHNRSNDFYTDSDGNLKPNPVSVQRDRLILDTDKWLLSKLMPKKYGDRLTLDGEVKTGAPLTIENINVILNELKE